MHAGREEVLLCDVILVVVPCLPYNPLIPTKNTQNECYYYDNQ